ncbi:Galanin receptor type 2 [Schistosoma haematobium]|uniref:Galanin receptor type 2 n=1 Tax=Schistosoma haematobium TaxID=6185 RepID=A0A922IT92_SCHHA|nr:Galanin receptor type 2 [Schistosoma haematobium]KAH9585584.1 Galanin receptor type 2 [Schistosoma haematobium]CAH8523255.1 unnamed protein product [Schistosoma haematobium]CAH8526195.1 unnamed protein product [Schistosoma haematobium]
MILIIFITVLFPVFSNSINNTINHDVSMELHSIIRPDIEISVIIMACLVCCIVTIGIIGNVLVICVLTCNQTRMVYETFCVGLAVTDLIYLTMTSPITVMQYFLKSWIFGIFWCKVFNFIVQVTVFSSAFMLLGLTTSRFLAVVLPWQNLKMTEVQAKLVCFGAWLVGIIFALPIIIFQVLIPAPRDDILPDNITLLSTTSTDISNNTYYLTEIPQIYTSTSKQTHDLITTYLNINNNNNNYNQEVFCREQFPTQSSRMGYQLFVLLSTYVLPFACILILNSCIVLKLKQKNVAERETGQLKRTSLHDNSIYTRNNNNSVTNNNSNTNESFNSSQKSTKKRRLFSIQQQCGSHRSDDTHENISHNYDNHPHHHRQQQRLEQQLSDDTTTSDYNTSTTSNIGTGHRSSTKSCIQKCDFHENIQQNPNELIRATRELKKKRLRSKATKLVVLVTTLWGVCWLPTHIINSWFFFDEASFPFVPAMKIVKLLSQTLSFAASCVNPVVYSILTGSFKTALSNRLLRFRKRNKRNDHTKTEILYITE